MNINRNLQFQAKLNLVKELKAQPRNKSVQQQKIPELVDDVVFSTVDFSSFEKSIGGMDNGGIVVNNFIKSLENFINKIVSGINNVNGTIDTTTLTPGDKSNQGQPIPPQPTVNGTNNSSNDALVNTGGEKPVDLTLTPGDKSNQGQPIPPQPTVNGTNNSSNDALVNTGG
ncbi:hypothetical protein IJ818_07565, partial [bacterium]|nr:hypothetical protein [bacterium]